MNHDDVVDGPKKELHREWTTSDLVREDRVPTLPPLVCWNGVAPQERELGL